ncbi:MAG: peptidylprolyl isomerase [Lachnospiraceae bacterium]
MSQEVLATVAGKEITDKDVENLIANYPPEQRIYVTSPSARPELVEQLISFELFAKMAEEEKIDETEEFKETLERMKRELASHMAVSSILKELQVTQDEESIYYREHQNEFKQGASVRARHILVAEEAEAKKIAEEIANGKSFSEAAKEYSTCPSKEQGGDLGFFQKGQMVPEFEKAAFEAELNKIVGPVQTQFGYHLILVEDKKEESVTPFEMVKQQIHDTLLHDKQQEVYAAKVDELEKKYGVERHL